MPLSPILNVACSVLRLAHDAGIFIEIVVGSAGCLTHLGNVASRDIMLFSDPSPSGMYLEMITVFVSVDWETSSHCFHFLGWTRISQLSSGDEQRVRLPTSEQVASCIRHEHIAIWGLRAAPWEMPLRSPMTPTSLNRACRRLCRMQYPPWQRTCECVCIWIWSLSDGLAFHNFSPVTSSTSDCQPRNLLHPASDTSNCESGTAGSSMAVLGCCLVLGLWTLPSPILGSACSFLRLTDDGGISSSRLLLALQDAPATLAM
ncbi:hypothetical protein C8F01DRAFT_647952 [Mycena amicta]|nr:hypothetical protein C8F01DRAFT_647952 [Mycena amicta]